MYRLLRAKSSVGNKEMFYSSHPFPSFLAFFKTFFFYISLSIFFLAWFRLFRLFYVSINFLSLFCLLFLTIMIFLSSILATNFFSEFLSFFFISWFYFCLMFFFTKLVLVELKSKTILNRKWEDWVLSDN